MEAKGKMEERKKRRKDQGKNFAEVGLFWKKESRREEGGCEGRGVLKRAGRSRGEGGR